MSESEKPVTRDDMEALESWCLGEQYEESKEIVALPHVVHNDPARVEAILALTTINRFRTLKRVNDAASRVDEVLDARLESMHPRDVMAYRDRLVKDRQYLEDRLSPPVEVPAKSPKGGPLVQVQMNNSSNQQVSPVLPSSVGAAASPDGRLKPIQRMRVLQALEGILGRTKDKEE
jgi:hypothetical protein